MAPRSLLFLPLATYALSYVHLAAYHGKAWIWTTVIHEGGKYTLLETTFYASHFLGHVPVHTALAFILVGWNRAFSRDPLPPRSSTKSSGILLGAIVVLLAAAYWLSLEVFGAADTHDYIRQAKQSVSRHEDGGSWKLHLPSTITMFLVIPATVLICRLWCRAGARLRRDGLPSVATGIAIVIACTLCFDPTPLASLIEVWTDPRYVAHSVREIATFPLTYFAPALYFLLRGRERTGSLFDVDGPTRRLAIILAAALVAAFAYQCWLPLSRGSIGAIAQKPEFARDGELGVVYLLTSHYFEHFLDTVYFILVCVLLDGLIATRRAT